MRDSKPRLLLLFRPIPASPVAALGLDVVVKVYGDRPRGEGPLLKLSQSRGIPTPRVQCGEHDGCSWLVLEYLRLAPVRVPRKLDRTALTRQVAGLARRLHQPAPELHPVLRPLSSLMPQRWDAATGALMSSGNPVPTSWRESMLVAYGPNDAGVPLHGDLGLPNLGRTGKGQLVVFDASALLGASAFDAARWCARLSAPELDPRALLQSWTAVEPLGNGVDALLAAECVMEAGSRVIQHQEGGVPETDLAGLATLLRAAASLYSSN